MRPCSGRKTWTIPILATTSTPCIVQGGSAQYRSRARTREAYMDPSHHLDRPLVCWNHALDVYNHDVLSSNCRSSRSDSQSCDVATGTAKCQCRLAWGGEQSGQCLISSRLYASTHMSQRLLLSTPTRPIRLSIRLLPCLRAIVDALAVIHRYCISKQNQRKRQRPK
jgi:hypothetical protein